MAWLRRASNSDNANAALQRAKARLGALELYPREVEIDRVRLVHAPRFFVLPFLRRFQGYATHRRIIVRQPLELCSEELLTHELCHVWQMQHQPIRMPLSYVLHGYRNNPFEKEARWAARTTCNTSGPPSEAASDH